MIHIEKMRNEFLVKVKDYNELEFKVETRSNQKIRVIL